MSRRTLAEHIREAIRAHVEAGHDLRDDPEASTLLEVQVLVCVQLWLLTKETVYRDNGLINEAEVVRDLRESVSPE